jgi:hypothetical protein
MKRILPLLFGLLAIGYALAIYVSTLAFYKDYVRDDKIVNWWGLAR